MTSVGGILFQANALSEHLNDVSSFILIWMYRQCLHDVKDGNLLFKLNFRSQMSSQHQQIISTIHPQAMSKFCTLKLSCNLAIPQVFHLFCCHAHSIMKTFFWKCQFCRLMCRPSYGTWLPMSLHCSRMLFLSIKFWQLRGSFSHQFRYSFWCRSYIWKCLQWKEISHGFAFVTKKHLNYDFRIATSNLA